KASAASSATSTAKERVKRVIEFLLQARQRISVFPGALVRHGAKMADYLRLRQICLVARELEPVLADIRAILGLEICYRDSGVAKYGLVNALLPIGTSFLELVAPVEPNTAAGRFLDRKSTRLNSS